MNIQLKQKFDAQLPATPCTSDVRNRIKEIAYKQRASMAEVQRRAIDIFLDQYATISSNDE